MKQLIEEAVERLGRHADRDDEFIARFGRFRRPEFAARYPLMELLRRFVRWDPLGESVIDVSGFVRGLREEDRRIAGEIARFVCEAYEGRPATDKTLNLFILDYGRRLDACGF